MPNWDLLLTDVHVATMRAGESGYGAIENAAIGIVNGQLEWIGAAADLPHSDASETRSLAGRWATPALIDCHTHLVFGGDRSGEFEQRLRGASYEDIARAGGGIMSTVTATRETEAETLLDSALRRATALANEGVATVEIKSGYGLDVQSELKMLAVARQVGEKSGICVSPTLLAAHAVPPEYRNNADSYIDLICDELLPQVASDGLADAVDAYCESFAFSAAQIAKLFACAQSLGLPVKLHADQLSDGGGAELAARFTALSADHLEYTSSNGVKALAQAGSVAVLLPGAFLTLGETQRPPVAELRNEGVPIAIATDCNPGTSPLCSVREAMAIGCRVFQLTPQECLAGATREAARALGLSDDRGTLETGKRADIAIWDINHPRELSYWLGVKPLAGLLINGAEFNLS